MEEPGFCTKRFSSKRFPSGSGACGVRPPSGAGGVPGPDPGGLPHGGRGSTGGSGRHTGLLPTPEFVLPSARRGRWNLTTDPSSPRSRVGTFQRDPSPSHSYTAARGARAATRGSFGKRKEPAPFPKPQRWGLCSGCPNVAPRSGPAAAPKCLRSAGSQRPLLGKAPSQALPNPGENRAGQGTSAWGMSHPALHHPRTRAAPQQPQEPRGAAPGWGCHSGFPQRQDQAGGVTLGSPRGRTRLGVSL
ncbi:uncharacterized protein LOC111944784 [Cyanistes caeruleus]|uniref:uncharacterized protein LOC111944784 n=1 Tax=Cyanistes caeruleus TaxID=156563 RepID=UPI000CDB855B|nr:uncharacterized protein LOC111944784 [Cyanistes caeruleus]